MEVLRRPPESWSAAEVAHWALRPREQGGAALGQLITDRLWENAIDGHLLLMYGSDVSSGGEVVVADELSRVLGFTANGQRVAVHKVR